MDSPAMFLHENQTIPSAAVTPEELPPAVTAAFLLLLGDIRTLPAEGACSPRLELKHSVLLQLLQARGMTHTHGTVLGSIIIVQLSL